MTKGRAQALPFLVGVVLDVSAGYGLAPEHSMYSFLLRNA